MLTLYTSKEALIKDYHKPNFQLVTDADSYFDERVKTGEITVTDCNWMAEFLTQTRRLLHGGQDLLRLSTSCKTLILAEKYQNLILTTGNISREAALYLLMSHCDSDRSFIYYASEDTGQSDDLLCDIEPQTIIMDDDCLAATVVSETGRAICNTYGELKKELYFARAKVPTSCVGLWDGIFDDESSEPLEKEENEIYSRGFDRSYMFMRNSLAIKGAVPDHSCNRASCMNRINIFTDCFVVGGQHIGYVTYDDNIERVLVIHSPFGTEPTEEQLEMLEEYAVKLGYISEDEDDEESEYTAYVSEPIVKSLQYDFKKTHLINYYINECGKPQIMNIFNETPGINQTEASFRWVNLMQSLVSQSTTMKEEDYWSDPSWQYDGNWDKEDGPDEQDDVDADWDEDEDDEYDRVIEVDPDADVIKLEPDNEDDDSDVIDEWFDDAGNIIL